MPSHADEQVSQNERPVFQTCPIVAVQSFDPVVMLGPG